MSPQGMEQATPHADIYQDVSFEFFQYLGIWGFDLIFIWYCRGDSLWHLLSHLQRKNYFLLL